MEEIIWNVCCFTGHRQLPLDRLDRLLELMNRAVRIVYRRGVREFRAGGALGFDTLAALCVLDLKEEYNDVRLTLYLPCKDQADRWSERDRMIYADILSRADRVIYTSERYHSGCMHARNRALVDGSDICIALCSEQTGGSAYTVQYASAKGVPVLNLATSLV